MFSINDRPAHLCDRISRRELIRVGGLSTLGLSLPMLLRSRPAQAQSASQSFGRAKNVIYLWLQGGPPQHETFDPKPDAPAEIRGEFQPIQTNIPGIHFCELLPRTAARADKLAVVRSICTHSDLHDASGYWVLTGYQYTGQESRQISPSDWPYLGSVLKQLKPSESAPAFSSIWLPDVMRLNDNVMPAGQSAGFLGSSWDPFRLVCDPADPEFRVDGLELPENVPPLRLERRRSLLEQANQHLDALEQHAALRNYSAQAQEAMGLLTSGQGRTAFDLHREPEGLRDRYGRNTWGQSLILARRLIEAGARLVHVNWPRDPGDEAVNNPLWDTHAQNADRLQDVLCPIFDIGFSALLDDLEARGLLDETLVVAIGEFGRTPRINSNGGRDHWGHVFSFALAGAGISGGQVYGSSDRHGAYPRDGRLEPQDLTATIVHLLGVEHNAMFLDASDRPYHVTKGEPLYQLLGDQPATTERVEPTGNLAMVPAYTPDHLLNRYFEDDVPLVAVGSGKRFKGWQGTPLVEVDSASVLNVRLRPVPDRRKSSGRAAALGYDLTESPDDAEIASESWAMLTQEIRNPRAGTYTVTIHASTLGTPEALDSFLDHFRCRLLLFGYNDLSKNSVTQRREFASTIFNPRRAGSEPDFAPVQVRYNLRSQDDGANEIEKGVGIAVLVEKTAPGALPLEGGQCALLLIDRVEIDFDPRPRNDDVTV